MRRMRERKKMQGEKEKNRENANEMADIDRQIRSQTTYTDKRDLTALYTQFAKLTNTPHKNAFRQSLTQKRTSPALYSSSKKKKKKEAMFPLFAQCIFPLMLTGPYTGQTCLLTFCLALSGLS